MLPVAILAGGLATRLRPLTETIPKAMAPVCGEPFIVHQLRLLKARGFSQVALCLGYKGEQVEELIGDGAVFGLNVCYSYDYPRLLGTGGALRQALPLLGDAFFVLYGDSYLDIAYGPVEEAFHASGLPALMTVFRNEGRWDTSNVVFHAGQIEKYDKVDRVPEMAHIDYGLGVLSAAVLRSRPAEEPFDLADVYRDLAREEQLAGYEVTERFYEIGTPDSLREFETHLENMNP